MSSNSVGWQAIEDELGYLNIYFPDDETGSGDLIATCYQDEATANLIAAAPLLRDALQLVWDTYGFDPSIDSSIWQTVQSALQAAQ